MNVFVVLPAFNEEAALPPLIGSLLATLSDAGVPHHIIVVDDGSTDATASIASGYSSEMVTLLRHQRNSGLGAALKTGLMYCVKHGNPNDVVVVMDADNTHPPELIVSLLQHLEKGAQVAIASRFVPGAEVLGVPAYRRICSNVVSTLYRARYPARNLADYTCGYRAYSLANLQESARLYGDALITESGFACMLELLLKLRALGATFAESPLVLRYDKKATPSKMRVLSTIKRSLRLYFRGVKRPPS